MITPGSEAVFWNEAEMVQYFATKAPDPRVLDRMRALSSNTSSRALDLGCGGGRHSQALVEADFVTTAVDVNPAMLANTATRTRHLSERIDVGFGSISGIPIADDIFDFVVSTGVLHQARSSQALEGSLAEIARVSQKGSVLIGNMFVSDVWDDSYTIPDPVRPEFVETQEQVGMTLIDANRAVAMFKRNGFAFEIDPVLDFKQENTGPRGVLRFSVEVTR